MQRFVPTGTGAVEPTKPQPSGEVTAAPPIKTKTNNKKAVSEVSIKRESFLCPPQSPGWIRWSLDAPLNALRNGMGEPKLWFLIKKGGKGKSQKP